MFIKLSECSNLLCVNIKPVRKARIPHSKKKRWKRRGEEKENFFVVSSRNYKITLIQSGTHFLNYHLAGGER